MIRWCAALLLFFCANAWAGGVESHIDCPGAEPKLRVGEEISLTITTNIQLAERQENEPAWQAWGPFLLHSAEAVLEKNPQEGWSKIKLPAYIAAASSTTPPSGKFHWGEHTLELSCANPITIESQLSAEEKQKGPRYFWDLAKYGGWNTWLIALLFIASAGLLIYLSHFFWSKWKKAREQTQSPEDILAATLRNLREQASGKILNALASKKFSYALTASLKQYLSTRTAVSILDLTDTEIMTELDRIAIPAITKKNFKEILNETYASRYSQSEIAATVANNLLQLADAILHEMRPVTTSKERK